MLNERIVVDGETLPGTKFRLLNDENRHEVKVYCKKQSGS
jgi:hypothetical protein